MRSDRGSVTIWILGLSLLLLLFGGLVLDFWRGLATQRELAAVADSAAIAAGSGIDEEHYRASGEVVLDESRARDLALASVGFQDLDGVAVEVVVDPAEVTVTVVGVVELGLLGVLIDDSEPLTVRAAATAVPRLIP